MGSLNHCGLVAMGYSYRLTFMYQNGIKKVHLASQSANSKETSSKANRDKYFSSCLMEYFKSHSDNGENNLMR